MRFFKINIIVLNVCMLAMYVMHNNAMQAPILTLQAYLDRTLFLDVMLPNNALVCTKTLLACRANVNARDQFGLTPVHYAAQRGLVHVLECLINDPGYISDVPNSNGSSPLMMAVIGNSFDCVKMLIDGRSSVNYANNMQETALHYASCLGNQKIVQFLIDQNANVFARTVQYKTAYDFAWRNKHSEIASLLVAKMCDHWVLKTLK